MHRKAALLVVDVQSDFCPGGALAVPDGDAVVPVLNRYISLFWQRGAPIIASRDWHPADSEHFLDQGGIWPTHCVRDTPGAGFHPELLLPEGTIVVSKGVTRWEDGYSALGGNTDSGTPLSMLLRHLGLDRLFVAGLATDYCVKQSVLDALKEGFPVTLLTDAVRAVEVHPGDGAAALEEMRKAGASSATLDNIEETLAAAS